MSVSVSVCVSVCVCVCVCVSVSLLSIFNVIKCQLYIQVGLDSKILPPSGSNPGNCCLQLYLGVRARSAETLLYLLGFLLLLLLLLFRRKTHRAAQTVRARELKLGQKVVVLLATQIQRIGQIGLTGALQRKKLNFQTFLAIARTRFGVDSKTLHRCDPWVRTKKTGLRQIFSTTHGFFRKIE